MPVTSASGKACCSHLLLMPVLQPTSKMVLGKEMLCCCMYSCKEHRDPGG